MALVNAPFLVAEQLALQQGFRQGGAVDRDQRPGPADGRLVDGPGHLLLAGAGLALDQHGRRGVGDVGDQLEDRVHPRVLAEDVVELESALQLGPQRGHFVLQGPVAQGPLEDQPEVVDVDRLGQKVIGPHADRLDGLVDRAVAGGDDDRDRQPAALDLLEQLHPVQPRHPQVGDQDGVVVFQQPLEGLVAVLGGVHLQTGVGLQQGLKLGSGSLVVLDNQDPAAGRGLVRAAGRRGGWSHAFCIFSGVSHN